MLHSNPIISLLQWFHKLVGIKSDSDFKFSYEQIKKDINVRGASFIYLICSAIIASVGLDVGSPAVIIGAMLISPLMSPILGIGFSLGIHDKEIFLISIREFLFSIIFSLIISTLYFFLSPLGTINSELSARIKPTVLDIIIALFGGISGIVALTRKSVGNALPGVAIATALMPPICTAGFGIGTGRIEYFLGAIYLFFINTVFIAFSSYIIVKYLRFPVKSYPDRKQLLLTRILIAAVIIIVAIPSIKIFIDIISDLKYKDKVLNFVQSEIQSRSGIEVLEWKLLPVSEDNYILNVFVIGKPVTKSLQDSLTNLLLSEGIEKTKLNIVQITNRFNLEYLKHEMKTDLLAWTRLLQEQQEQKLVQSKNSLDSLRVVNALLELRILYPDIKEIGISNNLITISPTNNIESHRSIPVLRIVWNNLKNNKQFQLLKEKIYPLMQEKLGVDSLVLISE